MEINVRELFLRHIPSSTLNVRYSLHLMKIDFSNNSISFHISLSSSSINYSPECISLGVLTALQYLHYQIESDFPKS